MDEGVRIVTELELRREVAGIDRPELVVHLELRGAQLDVRTLRRWEERAHAPMAVHRNELCEYFQVSSAAALGLGCGPEAARYWTWMTEDERTLEVHRRRFCIATATTTGALLLPVSKLTAAAQLLGGYPRIGAADVTFATEVATDIASAYLATPSPEVRRAAKAHAYTLLDLLKRATMSPDTETKLSAIASDAASMVGYGYLDEGRLDQADGWFATALTLARQAGNRRLEAFALASRGWIPIYNPEPDPAAAVAAFEPAAEFQQFLPPAGRAWVFGNLALERAALGDDLVSGRFLEQACTAAARIPVDEPGWGWWSTHAQLAGWDGARSKVYTGVRSLRIGLPAEAVGLFDAAFQGTASPVRRAWLQDDLTHACVALGDPERACAAAMGALDVAKVHELGIIPGKIRQARKRFPKEWNVLAPVVELDERLRAVA